MKLSPTQRKNLVPLVLFLANLIFLYIGGLIFKSIEYEPRKKHTTIDDVALFLKTLKKTSMGKQILPKDFNSEAAAKELNSESLKNLDAKFESIRDERTAASLPGWSFSNSLFFATTVVTTIGYGNLAPVTFVGRMFCVLYALIGIPLTLMLLAVVGNHIVHYLNEACAWLVNRIRAYNATYEFESADDQINAPVWVALPIIFVFLAVMSCMYCALEGWDFGTALYFIFITFTTIGFGDIVPTSAAGIWINLMLLYVGLSIVSITINLCAQSLLTQMKKTGVYLKVLQLFSSQTESAESNSASAKRKEAADDHRSGHEENIAMTDLKDRRNADHAEDNKKAARMKIVRDVDGKRYGALPE
ncbi:TWiK family of potassium channels protein 7-like isoform X2 [Montipora capricornis]|uniref:TWiK family of potassium channels protein 7-like isoform X2 n=1 Tax=Montipora capricornis TaxID=246305 RepID=UPI0035F16770